MEKSVAHKSADEDVAEQLLEELSAAQPSQALDVVSRWLASQRLDMAANALIKETATDPSKWGSGSKASSGTVAAITAAPAHQVSTAAAPPIGEALPVPGTSTRPGRLFDAEPVNPSSVPEALLTKPDPVFFGERDDKKRERAATEEFPLTVRMPS